MVKEFVSPAVITNEIDETELGAGLAEIGPVIISACEKGPAFKPTNVTYWPDFVAQFGKQDPSRLGVYAARLGLRTLSNINMVRVLGPDGTTHTNGNDIAPGFKADDAWSIEVSGASGEVMAIIHTSGTYHMVVTDLDAGKFYLDIMDGTGVTVAESTGSFNSGSEDYIRNVFNDDPTNYHTEGYYIHRVYQHDYKNNAANPTWESASFGSTYSDYTTGYRSGSTPWVKSQPFGSTEYNLMKLHTLGDGTNENTNVKITFSNMKPSVSPDTSPYGTFDVIVRQWGDTDQNMAILEQFSNLTFNPKSNNFIGRRIGDKFLQWNNSIGKFIEEGSYDSQSKYIRVELTGSTFPNTSVPWGFRGYGKMSASIPALPYTYDLKNTKGIYSTRLTWGVQFNSSSIEERLYERPNSKASEASDSDFSLKSVSGSSSATYAYDATWTGTLPGTSFAGYARFTMAPERGFDGWDIHMTDPIDNTLLGDTASYASASWTARNAFRRAVDTVSNEDEVDTNLLVIPGVYHEFVADYALDMIHDRSDAFYVMAVSGNTKTDVINYVAGRGLDTSYAACYYPHVMIEDTDNNTRLFVDPTTIVPFVFGQNDSLGQPYYAPAGFNRALLDGVVLGVRESLSKSDRDDLYRNRINPIAKFKEGIAVWGQKTLQVKDSALNRINIRRLLLHVKKAVASYSRYLVFEQNAAITWQRFENGIRPILDNLVATYGIKKYIIKMNEETVTKEHEERNEMPGIIKIMPYRTAEIIPIDFVLSENGASFEA